MPALLDTNILVYRFDSRDSEKQALAEKLMRDGISKGDLRIPHQAILEFIAATTRPNRSGKSLLSPDAARREAEGFTQQYPILFPNAAILRLALRGWAMYGFSWFDAHLWAYAEHFSLSPLYSEDFEHDRIYGTVRVKNPFR
jgi:predicted nucleic acid-binding protein